MKEMTKETLAVIEKMCDWPIELLRDAACEDDPSRKEKEAAGLYHMTRGGLIRLILERDNEDVGEGEGWQGEDTRPT